MVVKFYVINQTIVNLILIVRSGYIHNTTKLLAFHEFGIFKVIFIANFVMEVKINIFLCRMAITLKIKQFNCFLVSRFVIIDEAHAYKGAFGCHTALILRRLRRICGHGIFSLYSYSSFIHMGIFIHLILLLSPKTNKLWF